MGFGCAKGYMSKISQPLRMLPLLICRFPLASAVMCVHPILMSLHRTRSNQQLHVCVRFRKIHRISFCCFGSNPDNNVVKCVENVDISLLQRSLTTHCMHKMRSYTAVHTTAIQKHALKKYESDLALQRTRLREVIYRLQGKHRRTSTVE